VKNTLGFISETHWGTTHQILPIYFLTADGFMIRIIDSLMPWSLPSHFLTQLLYEFLRPHACYYTIHPILPRVITLTL